MSRCIYIYTRGFSHDGAHQYLGEGMITSPPPRALQHVLFRASAHRPVLVLTGVSAAIPLCAMQVSLAEAETLLKEGSALGDKGEWAEAVVLLRAAVVVCPECNTWCLVGFAEDKIAGDYCEASVEPYTRCLQHNPTSLGAHTNLAAVLLHVRRDVDEAERLLRSALDLDPESPDAHAHFSELLEKERGDLDGAIAAMESCLRFGGIPGWDGEAKLVWLKEKKMKAEEVRVATMMGMSIANNRRQHHPSRRTRMYSPAAPMLPLMRTYVLSLSLSSHLSYPQPALNSAARGAAHRDHAHTPLARRPPGCLRCRCVTLAPSLWRDHRSDIYKIPTTRECVK